MAKTQKNKHKSRIRQRKSRRKIGTRMYKNYTEEMLKLACESVESVSTENFIGSKCDDFDTVLIGDMFYDAEFANMLFKWLRQLTDDGKTVIIGDPGRHGLTDTMRQYITLLA
ncbi:Uncharacterized protein OBRU01_06906, partial [Operophtera brumata]